MDATSESPTLGVVAGNGAYPRAIIEGARKQVPGIKIYAVAFLDETRTDIEELADYVCWCRVGQITKPMKFLQKNGVKQAVMVGQLAPANLFKLRPDMRALILLATLPRRNAETLFGAVADEAEKYGITVLSSITYMDDHLPSPGHIAGPQPSRMQIGDGEYGMEIAKAVSKLDIGQSVLVRHGTVLAVEGFEGTNECIKRGGLLGRGKDITLVKVSKPGQDMRFDVPVVGPDTIKACATAGVSQIVMEAHKTILLDREQVSEMCKKHKIILRAIL